MAKAGPSEPDPSAASQTASPEAELPFEAALERLEQVVDRLEHADLELEESLAAFEEGVRLTRRCASELDAADQRIEVLMREGGKWLARPFADTDQADEERPIEEAD